MTIAKEEIRQGVEAECVCVLGVDILDRMSRKGTGRSDI